MTRWSRAQGGAPRLQCLSATHAAQQEGFTRYAYPMPLMIPVSMGVKRVDLWPSSVLESQCTVMPGAVSKPPRESVTALATATESSTSRHKRMSRLSQGMRHVYLAYLATSRNARKGEGNGWRG